MELVLAVIDFEVPLEECLAVQKEVVGAVRGIGFLELRFEINYVLL